MRRLCTLVATALLFTAHPSAAGVQEAVQAYQRAVALVCEKNVTPEMVRLYQAALKEMETARYGQGRDSNFFGLRTPERAHSDCLQTPGVLSR
jgi:hypothetical protein